jgi:colanic acid/amylovoran biosynthesis glycosyltransferase
MKIAIFSGAIPSSTFIEHLIEGVAPYHTIMLFGVIEKRKQYSSKAVKIYKTPYSHLINLGYTLGRLVLLAFQRPGEILKLVKEVKKYDRFYDRWIWFSKFLPIVLYRPDIVHVQWARDLDFYYFLKERFNMKLIVSLRGAHINYTPIIEPRIAQLYRHSFPNIDAFHAVSVAISKEALHYGADPDKISLIHSPIQNVFFDAFTLLKKQNMKTIRIVSVGRFHWKKGFKYAFDAISLLKDSGIDIMYTIIGSEALSEALLFQMHQLKLEEHIVLIAAMPQEDLIQALKSYDVLLLPSVEEGIANVVLEAMAVGLPVISSDSGGMSEVVRHKETGWLVPVRDPQAIADAIIEVAGTSESELQDMTQNAYNFVKTNFNAEDSIQQFVELYDRVMNTNI